MRSIDLADAAEDLLARLDELLPPLDRRLGQRLPAGHALEEPALAEIGQQPREPRRPGRPVALLGQADELDQRVRPVEHLEDARVVVRQPQEGPAREIAQHPALAPLGGVEPLERVARAHARLHPEVRAGGRRHRRQHRALLDDDRAPGLGRLAPPLDAQLGVAEPDLRPVAQLRRLRSRRTPSSHVPWLEPASSSTASAVIRACTRETDGSDSSSETPGARPIVSSPTTGTRVASASTSSSGAAEPFSGVPQLPQ